MYKKYISGIENYIAGLENRVHQQENDSNHMRKLLYQIKYKALSLKTPEEKVAAINELLSNECPHGPNNEIG